MTDVFKKKASSKKAVSLPIGFQDFPLAEIEWDLDHKVLRWSKERSYFSGILIPM